MHESFMQWELFLSFETQAIGSNLMYGPHLSGQLLPTTPSSTQCEH